MSKSRFVSHCNRMTVPDLDSCTFVANITGLHPNTTYQNAVHQFSVQ